MNTSLYFREKDNYVNATQLCKAAKKVFKDWYRNAQTKKFLEKLSQEENIPIESRKIFESFSLIQFAEANQSVNNRMTWVHPRVAINIAQWVSVDFAVKVSGWMEEWKKHSPENEQKYQSSLNNIVPDDDRTQKERTIQKWLALSLSGQTEIECKFGFIDLMTQESIIEIKVYENWKHGLGQLMAYGRCFPNKKKILYLFDVPEQNQLTDIKELCDECGVAVEVWSDSKDQ